MTRVCTYSRPVTLQHATAETNVHGVAIAADDTEVSSML